MAGYIERMGTGATEVIRLCEEQGLRTPEFEQTAQFRTIIWRKEDTGEAGEKVARSNSRGNSQSNSQGVHQTVVHQSAHQEFSNTFVIKLKIIIAFCRIPRTSKEILSHISVSYQTKNIKKYVTDLVNMDILEMTNLTNPKDRQQKYIRNSKKNSSLWYLI